MQSEKATSLVQLQQLVSKNLKVITDSMLQKEELEREEKTMLLDSLNIMENRLAEVEKTATNYKKSLSEQRFKSLQDALTKLPNRAAFDERMEVEFRRWKRYGHSLCLAVIDIDHFKRINDTFGHSAGDRTLRVIAQSLRKTLRTTDFIARFGGEEFVVLIPEASINIIEGPLNKVRESIKRIPFKFKDQNVQITISIGATVFNEGDSAQVVFDRADAALYEAKNSGRDRVVLKSA
jgi:diguanylate cyclase (GGDEF)-like protein